MTFSTFATWVGIVAFVLAVPMSVLANILTPKIQANLAYRSEQALRKRLGTVLLKIYELDDISFHERVGIVLRELALTIAYFAALLLVFGGIKYFVIYSVNRWRVFVFLSSVYLLFELVTAMSRIFFHTDMLAPHKREKLKRELEAEAKQLQSRILTSVDTSSAK